jgi:quercetin dioxygenase-like cupin family protein
MQRQSRNLNRFDAPIQQVAFKWRSRGGAALAALFAMAGSMSAPLPAGAQGKYLVKPVAEMRIKQLPKGPLYWRVENFAALEQAKAAAGSYRWNPDTVSYDGSPSLVAEVAGKVWLFTLGAKGGATPGGSKVAEIGPLPPISAPEYLLRVNHGSGAPGSRTSTHTHPGSEAFYVVAGRLGQLTPHGERQVEAGGSMNGHGADMPMQVFNSGTTELTALIMFVVDGTKAFSTPARLPQK